MFQFALFEVIFLKDATATATVLRKQLKIVGS